MNMRYAKRSEDTEQINVVSWANWNVNRNHKMGECEIVIPLENRQELRNITMSIPNNSILKNGEIKESKPRKK